MATSRSRGDTALTTWSPKLMRPLVIVSSPATIRRVVVFPQPDGPTSTTNSPSATSRSSSSTALAPVEKTFVNFSSKIADIGGGTPLVRDAAEQQAAPPVALQYGKQRDHRDDRHQTAHHQEREEVGVSRVAGVLQPQAHSDRGREQVVGAEDDERQDVVVPGSRDRQQQHRQQSGHHQRQRYPVEDPHF